MTAEPVLSSVALANGRTKMTLAGPQRSSCICWVKCPLSMKTPLDFATVDRRKPDRLIPKALLTAAGGTQDRSLFQPRVVTLYREPTRVVETFALLNSGDSAVHQHSNAWKIS